MRAARRGARPAQPRRPPARPPPTGRALCLLGHVDTVLADPADWSVDPWSAELRDGAVWGRGALDMKSQVAAEVAAALALVEEGWRPEAGELMLVFTADEETGAAEGAQWLCREHPERVRADLVVNEGAGAHVRSRRPARLPGLRRREGRLPLHAHHRGPRRPRLGPRHRRQRARQDGPMLTALQRAAPVAGAHARAGGAAERARPRHRRPGRGARAVEVDPRLAVLLEPMLGVSMTPTILARRREDQRDPVAGASSQVDCRVPPEQGTRARAAPPSAEVLGDDGYEVEFHDDVVRQPLADRHAADGLDPPLRRARGPGRDRGAGWCSPASPTRTGGAPPSPTASPTASSRRARWTPSRPYSLMHAADEHVPGRRPRPGRQLLL